MLFVVAYGWFFQGGGWNQNSRFDVVRALVESRTLEITALADNTGDVARAGAAVYSNKPPGLSILAAPLYAGALLVERALGLSPDAPYVQTANAHLVTWAVAGVPGAALVALVFLYLVGVTGDHRRALLMAAAFGAGSLVLPYAGVLMNHLMVAAGLFGAWLALETERPSKATLAAGGVALGLAVFTEYLVGPLVLLYAALWWRRRDRLGAAAPLFWAGPVAAAVAVLALNTVMFGSPLRLSYQGQDPLFQSSGLFLGVFGVPDPRRLWWLSFHPYRGLFWCTPMFLLPLLGPGKVHGPRRVAFCLAVAAYFVLFNLAFNGWTGGWGIGPRYIIPALPFVFVLAAEPWRRHPVVRTLTVGLSVAFMTAATATLVMVPGPNDGPPPPGRDPVLETLALAAAGDVSMSEGAVFERFPGPSKDPRVDDRWDSYNVGELLGLRGLWSVLPVALLVAVGVGVLGGRAGEGAGETTEDPLVGEGAPAVGG